MDIRNAYQRTPLLHGMRLDIRHWRLSFNWHGIGDNQLEARLDRYVNSVEYIEQWNGMVEYCMEYMDYILECLIHRIKCHLARVYAYIINIMLVHPIFELLQA